MKAKGFTTAILHSDREGGVEHGSLHKPIHTSITFGHASAADIAAVFQGRQAGYTYARQINPTVVALEKKLSLMEDGLATCCFATGMAAISATLLSLLKAGDHLVSSSFLFGNTNSLFNTLQNFGIEVSFVDATDAANVAAALRPNTRAVFVETIANPCTQIADLAAIGELCAAHGVLYVVDNTMTGPWSFRPKTVNAGLVINSLSKFIGGHGNALGGAVTETGVFDWNSFPNIIESYKTGNAQNWGLQQIKKKGLRDTGASLSPESAHHLAVGAETLSLRQERSSSNAQTLAEWFSARPEIARVFFPGLPTHPQHALGKQLFRHSGSLMSIELKPEVDCFKFLDALALCVLTTNLGDNRTLVIPVAHTIYFEMGAARRAEMGISDGTVRMSIGIEDIEDLLADFEQALAAAR
ncbi:cystathionine gamma-synthase family protein [Uliginosibacterium flavum]|uniref:Cystathionine gamma-synthase family protein n=1 Tax=Uliginosibacterium flavum TaxID=1396831 RepID=A0ABV2TLN9_9RHOO